ncbi:MAG TPA: hypothetical protein VGM67_18225 [Gemmatimonadaceae bacterium]|jgi:hypothetical protein
MMRVVLNRIGGVVGLVGLVALAAHASVARAQQPPMPTTSGHTVIMSDVFVPKQGDSALVSFKAAVEADETGGECSLIRTAGNGATTVTAGFPARRNSKLLVSMTFDSVGHLMRYSERRGQVSLPPATGMTEAQRDSVLRVAVDRDRSTTISLDWGVDRALAMNRGGGLPTEATAGTVKAMEALPQLGPISARMERVRKLCGV